MNKLMGFYELKNLDIPTVPWKRFTRSTVLDDTLLWTLRIAVTGSNDLNLPRAVGVPAGEALEKGKAFLDQYEKSGIVIYYPYFVAHKSGVMEIKSGRTVIEAVDKDLWNLVTYGRKNLTVIMDRDGVQHTGDSRFLSEAELLELKQYARIMAGQYRSLLSEGKSLLAEWSFAYHAGADGLPKGDPYLVFYELRSL